MLRNLGIRWQILAALALPLLVLVVLGGQITYRSVQQMDEAQLSLDLSSTASSVSELVRGLGNERRLTVSALSGDVDAQAQLRSVRSANDVRIFRIRADIEGSGLPSAYRALLISAAAGHDRLAGLRDAVNGRLVAPAAAASRYTTIIAFDVNLPSEIAARLKDRATAASFRRFGLLGAAIEIQSQEQLTGLTVATAGTATLAQQRQLAAAQAVQSALLADFSRSAPADQKAGLADALARSADTVEGLDALRTRLASAGTAPPDIDPRVWLSVTQERISALTAVLNDVAAEGVTRTKNELATARLRAEVTAGAALAIVLLVLLAGMLMARRIAQPMRHLTKAATEIRDGLPQLVEQVHAGNDAAIEMPAVPVKSRRNEVGRLAAAFMDVNRVTVQVAREQAQLRAAIGEMFVNVARRNQVLLARQLAFIDQLERNEANPDSLDDLFRLDHLATRMRRNAESLLVLAGIESGRRLREPMPLSDVIRTATSEIEHYERVSLALEIDPAVHAHQALPLAHLLAELLENAANFSDPASTVVVMAAQSEDGVRVTVADEGLGIDADELAQLNARIETPSAADALGSQRLGFFVVGRLAQRLGAVIVLTSGRSGGTTVRIDLPPALFADPASAESSRQIDMAPAEQSLAAVDAAESQSAMALAMPELLDAPDFTDLISLHESDSGEGVVVERPAQDWLLTDLGSYRPESFGPPAPATVAEEGDAVDEIDEIDPVADEQDAEPDAEQVAERVARPALFSGFRSRRESLTPPAAAEPELEPELEREYVPDYIPAEPLAHEGMVPLQRQPQRDREPEPVPQLESHPESRPESQPVPQKSGPWQNLHGKDILPQRPVPARRSFRLGRRTAEPPRAEPPRAEPPHVAPPRAEPPRAAPVQGRLPGEAPEQNEGRNQEPAPGLGERPADPSLMHQTAAYHSAEDQDWPSGQLSQPGQPSQPPGEGRAVSPAESFADLPSASLPSRARVSQPAPEQSEHAPAPTENPFGAGRIPLFRASEAGSADRSHIASQALTELSRLSSYSPAAMEPQGGGLQRRTPSAVPAVAPGATDQPASQRARTASSVRSMLSGFKAGVERGRTSPSASRPASRTRGGPQFRQREGNSDD